jgi:hypothetical protein
VPVWWLQVVGLVAFALVLGVSFAAWRRREAPGTGRAYMIGLFVAGVLLLAVGVWAVAATA